MSRAANARGSRAGFRGGPPAGSKRCSSGRAPSAPGHGSGRPARSGSGSRDGPRRLRHDRQAIELGREPGRIATPSATPVAQDPRRIGGGVRRRLAVGKVRARYLRHWAVAGERTTPCERGRGRYPGVTNRSRWISRTTSRWMCRSTSKTRRSSVTLIDPSITFSRGTKPQSTSSRATASSTSMMVAYGRARPPRDRAGTAALPR